MLGGGKKNQKTYAKINSGPEAAGYDYDNAKKTSVTFTIGIQDGNESTGKRGVFPKTTGWLKMTTQTASYAYKREGIKYWLLSGKVMYLFRYTGAWKYSTRFFFHFNRQD